MFDILYAPWRSEYVEHKKVEGCVFCHIGSNPNKDDENYVLYRDEECFIVMNRYPYTPGHFMIIPNKHTNKIEDLEDELWCRINLYAKRGVKLLKDVLYAEGVNIGMNLGAAAGAGIAEHIHMHLVPRWQRDTNFITSIAHTRVYSADFDKIYKKLKDRADYFKL